MGRFFSTAERKKLLIDTDELSKLMESENGGKLKIVNGTWFMPVEKRNGEKEHMERRIPGSQFFDIDKIADTKSGLPHTIPTLEFFKS